MAEPGTDTTADPEFGSAGERSGGFTGGDSR